MTSPFFIAGLRYAPGMWQHMESFADSLQSRGVEVRLLISSGYRWMNHKFEEVTNYTAYSSDAVSSLIDLVLLLLWRWSGLIRIFKKYPPSGLLLISWHPLNFFLILLMKALYPRVPIIACIHEPYKEKEEKKIYGWKVAIIYLIEFTQELSLRYTDVAVLHSRRGLRLFDKRYPNFHGKKVVIPLLFSDHGPSQSVERGYVSFLGRAEKAKGIDAFFALVDHGAHDKAKWLYQIVTSSNIQGYLDRLSGAARQRLRVISKPQVSDEELREAAGNSLAALALYKETMQSGIIPIAMMKGTPVIGTDIEGITEWIKDEQTGIIVSVPPSADEILAAIDHIQKNITKMTSRCRDYYISTFDDSNWEKYYGWLPELLLYGNGKEQQLAKQ
jgi:glycosyltransferase involved in cell wall biosynthesis